MESLLLVGSNRSLITSVDQNGVVELTKLAIDSANDPHELEMITLRTVLGATETMPLRVLEYLLPALQYVDQLRRQYSNSVYAHQRRISPLPRVEFVCMTEAGVTINKLDADKARQQAALFVTTATQFIQTFYPELASAIHFVDDRELTSALFGSDSYMELVNRFPQAFIDKPEALASLKDFSEGKGGQLLADKYTALHVFLHDGNLPTLPRLHPMLGSEEIKLEDAELLISIGAQTEKVFYQARQALKTQLGENDDFVPTRTVQFLTKQTVPPYSPLPMYDISLAEALENPKLLREVASPPEGHPGFHTPVKKAVAHLAEACGGLSYLIKFLEEVNNK